ncbi:MAG: alkaline phosphatase family protein [Armatimonadota bacterium]
MPSITPVNFATMVSGAELDVHAVRSKELDFQCETLFDVLEEAGMRGAGCGRPGYTGSDLLGRVAQIDGTADLIDDAAIEESVLRIAHEQTPEFIIAQIAGTDDHFHRFGPESPRMIPKLRETDCRLQHMVSELAALGYAVVVLSDHGQHQSGNDAKMGTHGTDSDEDCLVPCTWCAGR